MKNKVGFLFIIIGGCLLIFGGIFCSNVFSKKNFSLSYSQVGIMKNDFLVVSDGKYFGYVNATGKEISPLSFPLLDSMKNADNQIDLSSLSFEFGFAPFTTKENKMGLINKNGKEQIPALYDTVQVIGKDLILVSSMGKYSFFKANGKKVFPEEFDTVHLYSSFSNLFLVTKDGKYGLFTDRGKFLLNCHYDSIIEIKNNNSSGSLFYTKQNETTKNYLYMNHQLNALPFDSFPLSFSSNFISSRNVDGKYFVYDIEKKKTTLFEGDYVAMGPAENNLILVVNSENKVGYIDIQEKIVVPFQYHIESTMPFTSFGLAVVGFENFVGVIDRKGELVLPMEYSYIEILNDNLFLVKKEDEVQFIHRDGTELTKAYYDRVDQSSNPNYLITMKKNEVNYYGIVDSQGNEILKTEYLDIRISEQAITAKKSENQYFIYWL